jgi:hypothetical protein
MPGFMPGIHVLSIVMPALVAGIHVFTASQTSKTWLAGTTPGHDGRR